MQRRLHLNRSEASNRHVWWQGGPPWEKRTAPESDSGAVSGAGRQGFEPWDPVLWGQSLSRRPHSTTLAPSPSTGLRTSPGTCRLEALVRSPPGVLKPTSERGQADRAKLRNASAPASIPSGPPRRNGASCRRARLRRPREEAPDVRASSPGNARQLGNIKEILRRRPQDDRGGDDRFPGIPSASSGQALSRSRRISPPPRVAAAVRPTTARRPIPLRDRRAS